MTLEKAAETVDLSRCICEETLMLHTTGIVNHNTMEARVLVRIELPTGESYVANKTIKVRMTREKVEEA